jgi:DNA polymerase-3 subunit epsilon
MAEMFRKDLPNLPGVYRMSRSGGDLLYIGKAKSLKQRINSYFYKRGRYPEHILEMLSQARSLDTTVTRTAVEAALVESDEIKRFSPPYNRALQTNDRSILFFSLDLKHSKPIPDRKHTLGPFPSSRYIEPLVLLGDLLTGCTGKVSLKVIEKILDIPTEYLPDRDSFVSGVNAFKEEFRKSLQPAFNLTIWMSLGAQFWKEKLEEQAAEEAAKKEALEKAAEKALLEGSATKDNLCGIGIQRTGEKDAAGDSEAEEILELKMQESEDTEIEDTWTPERIVRVLKSIIRLSAFQVRRSRWFCRLSESSLIWTSLMGESETKNLIVFEGGTPIFRGPLVPSETIPLPPGHKRSLLDRQKNFDLLVLDRMRVATTEIRRLIQEERRVELWLHPDVHLRNEQLQRMFQWL